MIIKKAIKAHRIHLERDREKCQHQASTRLAPGQPRDTTMSMSSSMSPAAPTAQAGEAQQRCEPPARSGCARPASGAGGAPAHKVNGKKPEKLLQRIIDIATKPNDIILDYHLGSGTTCAVAHKMGRRYIGIEQLDYGKDVKDFNKIIDSFRFDDGYRY